MEFEFPLSVLDPHTEIVDSAQLNALLQKDFQNIQILIQHVDEASEALEKYSKEQLSLAKLRKASRPAIRGLLDQRNLEEHATIFADMHVVDQLKNKIDLKGLRELGIITNYEYARVDSGELMIRSAQDRINFENEAGEYSLEEDFGHTV